MKIVSNFKHLEHTPAIDQRIQEKSQKLKKYLEGNLEVIWTCSVREDGRHVADVKVLGPSFEYHASAHEENLYKCFDSVINKIERQVQKKKDKWKQNISHKHQNSIKDHLIAQAQWDEQFWEDKEQEDIAS
jgi:putative sigma-54 modulation protein